MFASHLAKAMLTLFNGTIVFDGMDRIVLDRTGLMGKYTFKLTYPPDPDTVSTTTSSQVESEARLFAALHDQLGLKLVAEKRPIPMLVIDSIERPTPN